MPNKQKVLAQELSGSCIKWIWDSGFSVFLGWLSSAEIEYNFKTFEDDLIKPSFYFSNYQECQKLSERSSQILCFQALTILTRQENELHREKNLFTFFFLFPQRIRKIWTSFSGKCFLVLHKLVILTWTSPEWPMIVIIVTEQVFFGCRLFRQIKLSSGWPNAVIKMMELQEYAHAAKGLTKVFFI